MVFVKLHDISPTYLGLKYIVLLAGITLIFGGRPSLQSLVICLGQQASAELLVLAFCFSLIGLNLVLMWLSSVYFGIKQGLVTTTVVIVDVAIDITRVIGMAVTMFLV